MNRFQEILQANWGYASFRPLQLEIIQSIAEGKDTLGLMPTGGGKSITFQVYSLSQEGICLVITPLIALMRDQVDNLNRRGIKALAIYSGMTRNEIEIAFDNALYGNYKFLYISPERIATDRFRERVERMNVNLITVDEAHCISQWGYDFRPSYLRIAELRELLPKVPVLALTATATREVVMDIQKQLRFPEENVLRQSFERKNLVYLVRQKDDKIQYLLKTLQKTKGSGIVYVRSRKRTRELAWELRQNKISADYYHAGLDSKVRSKKQEAWKNGETRVIVATNAFGMGIDKPDVRFVVHLDVPDSLEAYYQEAGRAGRDGKKAAAVLLFNPSDQLRLRKSVGENFPDLDYVRRVYHSLGNYFQLAEGFGRNQILDFSIGDFARNYNLQLIRAYNSLKILQREGYLELTDEIDSPAKVHFIMDRDELYKFQVNNARFDTFIKLLLRSYTGFFTDYIGIDEELLAKRASVPLDHVWKFLNTLNSYKVIRYIPRKKTPYIIFTKERLDPKRIFLSKENYDDRKKKYSRQIESVLYYAGTNHRCRSQLLMEYFGENDGPLCGTCDVCQSGNQKNETGDERDRIAAQVKTELLQQPLFFQELVDRMEDKETIVIPVIRWLSDQQKIKYREDNKLEWSGE